MMYGLRHDLREVGEAIIGGYSNRNEDPNLSTTLTKIVGFGALTDLAVREAKHFVENPNQTSGIRAVLLGVATAYAAANATDGIHDFAYSTHNTNPAITEGK